VSHQASTDTFDWARAKELLDPQPQPQRREWQPSPSSGPQNLDHLVRYVAECGDHVNDRLFWAACRMVEAGQDARLPELIQAAYAAGEDRRGQAERTVESALHTVRRGGWESDRPSARKAGCVDRLRRQLPGDAGGPDGTARCGRTHAGRDTAVTGTHRDTGGGGAGDSPGTWQPPR
jgi:hypothetical protein